MNRNIHMATIAARFWIFIAVVVFVPFIAQACHDGCGGSLICGCDSYGQSDYYSQGAYYDQSAYYVQSTYYVQATYYLQGGYWADIDQAWVRVSPQVVRYDDSVQVTWSGGNASACSLTGAGLATSTIRGTSTISAVTGEATITMNCNIGPNISIATATIKVLPGLKESYNTGSIFDFFKSQAASVIGWLGF